MIERFALGFSLGFDTGAAIVSSKRGLIAAVNEERITRRKQNKTFPINAIEECLKIAKIQMHNISAIAYSDYEVTTVDKLIDREYEHCENPRLAPVCEYYTKLRNGGQYVYLYDFIHGALKLLGNYDSSMTVLTRVDHHCAHINSILHFMKKKDNAIRYILSMDGFGDGLSACLAVENDGPGMFKILASKPLRESIGLVYQFTTGALGFTMHLHEGKITGMAARGNHLNAIAIYEFIETFMKNLNDQEFCKIYCEKHNIDMDKTSTIIDFHHFKMLKHFVFEQVIDHMKAHSWNQQAMFDVCAAVQKWTETAVISWLEEEFVCKIDLIDKHVKLGLVGGLFANVELNRKVSKLLSAAYDEIHIFPNMGDGGIGVGAAFHGLINTTPNDETIYNKMYKHMFLGHKVKLEHFYDLAEKDFDIIDKYNAVLIKKKPTKLAELIADGYIVANVEDEMEYGPRALCHRSIHFNCDDPDVSLWLNKQLGRTETMPFAPVIRHINALSSFEDYAPINFHTSQFMTINFEATEFFKENCPGAVHVDGTVRAQVISDHPTISSTIRNTLIQYEKLTNKVAFINTSFNKHGEPIVRTVKEAIERFEESNIHYLFINNMLLTNPKIDSLPKFTGETNG